MDDNVVALGFAVLALTVAVMVCKQLDRLRRDVDCLVDGDVETVKLRRKLDGYPKGREDG